VELAGLRGVLGEIFRPPIVGLDGLNALGIAFSVEIKRREIRYDHVNDNDVIVSDLLGRCDPSTAP
jgi:hypothetical protein